MGRRDFYHRRCRLVMTNRDELAFSRLVRASFPNTVFAEDNHRDHYNEMPVVASIAVARTNRVRLFVPDPGREERFRTNADFQRVLVPSAVRFAFDRSHWEWPFDPSKKYVFDPPLLGEGQFVASFPKHYETIRKFAMRVLGMTRRVTTGRGYGLDAMRWTQGVEGERRRLGGGEMWAPPDWRFPDNPFYDDSRWDDRMPPEDTLPSRGFP